MLMSMVFWFLHVQLQREPSIYEEHIASIFRLKSKPSKKLPEAGSKLSHLEWHISGQIFHAQFTQLAA
jgi:hypothetical protein